MRDILSSVIFIAAMLIAPAAFAAAVSANGLTCTATAASQKTLVECAGSFQGVGGLFQATGYDIVHVAYSPDNQKKYYYMSDTGCLILTAAGGASVAVDRQQKKSQFNSFMDAMNACYQGTK